MSEELNLIANVTDSFSSELDDLSDLLVEVGTLGEEVFPIDADVSGTSETIGELEGIAAAVEDIDETVTINTDVREAGFGSDTFSNSGFGGDIQRTGFEDSEIADGSKRHRLGGDEERNFSLTDLENISTNVSDEFDGIVESLSKIGILSEKVFPIEVEVEGASEAISELKIVEETVNSINEDVNIGTTVEPASTAIDGGVSADDGGESATADGGGTGILTRAELRDISQAFGSAFDKETLIRQGGEVSSPIQLLEGGIGDHMDTERMSRDILSGDLDMDVVSNLFSNDSDTFLSSLGRLGDYTDLPEEMTQLDKILEGMNLNMSQFYNILASLIPLLTVFIGALPAAIVGVGALAVAAIGAAAALAAFGGLAFLGLASQKGGGGMPSMEDLKSIFEDLRETAWEAFSPIANKLAPMATEAIDGFGRLLDDLGSQSGILLELKDDARALGGFIIQFLPPMLSKLAAFGDAMSGVFALLGDFALNTDFLGGMAKEAATIIPLLVRFTKHAIHLLPLVLQMSEGFLMVATAIVWTVSILSSLIHGLDMLIPIVSVSGEAFGALIGVLLTAITLTAVYAKMNSLLAGSFLANALTAIPAYVKSLYSLIAAEVGAFAATSMLIGALGVLTLGILPALGSAFTAVGSDINGAADALKRFSNASGPNRGMTDDFDGGGSYGGTYNDITINTTVEGNSSTSDSNYSSYRNASSLDSYFS